MKRNFTHKKDIAIIGMSGRFPMAKNLDEFWENLKGGVDCITEIPEDRWDLKKYYSDDMDDINRSYSKWGGFIKDAYDFDPAFFNISPKEATFLDPQQRKTLEVVYETFENAGYGGEKELDNSNTGVFMGMMGRGYYDKILAENRELEGHLLTSSLSGFIANRISYHFNLKGPSITLDTLCSSSLVALHLACNSILAGECEMALAGGVYINFSPHHYILLCNLRVLSRDGKCKTFDEYADGIVSGEGVGIVMLKELNRAIEDGDYIHAVIRGSVVNNDGKSTRLTTTNPEAQEEMLSRIFETTAINPETISYIETHGTGTALGDPIELLALTRAFKKYTRRKSFCAIGAIKSNIGHLEPAAGIAGLIKVILSMKHRKIPATLHVRRINHYIDMVNSSFIINDRLNSWESDGKPLRAGVSSFGMGGTNAHVIMEEAPGTKKRVIKRKIPCHLLTLSAKSEAALNKIVSNFAYYLSQFPDIPLQDLCFTANSSRGSFPHRLAISCHTIEELIEELWVISSGGVASIEPGDKSAYRKCRPDKKTAIFIFNNKIASNMGKDLFEYNPVFKKSILQCEKILRPNLNASLAKYLFTKVLDHRPIRILKAVCIQYAYAQMFISLGIKPEAVVFKGVGRYAAVVISDALSLKESLHHLLVARKTPSMPTWNQGRIQMYDLEKTSFPKDMGGTIVNIRQSINKNEWTNFLQRISQLYLNGADIKWDCFYPKNTVKRVPLPTYPFEQKRYIITEKPDKKIHPLVHRELSRRYNQCIYQTVFDNEMVSVFSGHRVLDRTVLPGAAFLEIARAAGSVCTEKHVTKLEDVILLSPFIVKEGTCLKVQIKHQNGDFIFTISSCLEDGHGVGKKHVTGKLSMEDLNEPEIMAPVNYREKCLKKVRISDFYENFAYSGVHYGSKFRLVNEVRHDDTELFASLKLHTPHSDEGKDFVLNPHLVDAALQSAVGLFFDEYYHKNRPYIPFYFESVQIYHPVLTDCYCVVKLLEKHPARVRTDVFVLTKMGKLLIKIKGLVLKQLTQQAEGWSEIRQGADGFPRKSQEIEENNYAEIKTWLYRPQWEPKILIGMRQANVKGRYLVFTSLADFDLYLMKRLRKARLDIIQVDGGSRFHEIDSHYYQIDPFQEKDYHRLIHNITRRGKNLKGILHLWPYSTGGEKNLTSRLQKSVYSIFFLLRELRREKFNNPMELLLVTDHAQAVLDTEAYLNPEEATIWGLARVIPLEFPNVRCGCLDISGRCEEADSLAEHSYREFMAGFPDSYAAYRDNKRYVWNLARPKYTQARYADLLKENGVYLITGGLGGIGMALTVYLAKTVKGNVVLLNRTPLSEKGGETIRTIEKLRDSGCMVDCYSIDVCDKSAMNQLVRKIRSKFGKITGVFHAAGELHDGLLKDKTFYEFQKVMQPKVYGTKFLYEVLEDEKPDFIIFFSSISSLIGNIGQGDYAAANAFMDSFAAWQNLKGMTTISINWAYWNIGMGKTVRQSAMRKGYKPFPAEDAINAMKYALHLGCHQIMIADRTEHKRQDRRPEMDPADKPGKSGQKHGPGFKALVENYIAMKLSVLLEYPMEALDREVSFTAFGLDSILANLFVEQLRNEMKIDIDATAVFDYPNIAHLTTYFYDTFPDQFKRLQEEKSSGGQDMSLVSLTQKLESILVGELAATLEYPPDAVELDSSFMELGIDSTLATQFVQRLGDKINIKLEPTLIFDYPSITSLAVHFLKHHRNELNSILVRDAGTETDMKGEKETTETLENDRGEKDHFEVRKENLEPLSLPQREETRTDTLVNENVHTGGYIAVIGMAGHFAGAKNIGQFWADLSASACNIRNFPTNRIDGDLEIFQHPDYLERKNRLFGSYLDQIEFFDALFFEISPREAELIDPQQRLLLETVWEAIPNAGYAKVKLSNSKTGVYIGACITEYTRFMKDPDARSGTGNEISILANRISYFLNLKGPSLTIDTACSSSLVALDMGCRGLQTGECDLALVGGVNLILTPWFTIVFEKAGMLSKSGLCHTFDDSADGYVRGEGAGVLLLKPLAKALEDRDNILGIIKGSRVNQDGRTNGLTAPNALSQEEVILEAWKNAGIDPRTITLVEAHGTGTSLGDPIEINGLSRAFQHFTKDFGFCAIGSVKTNIGHLEAAAGISGVIKVIEAMRNKQIPPTLHFNRKNRLINFNQSPFYVNDKLRDWESTNAPRRGAISSFGFGGTNAHVVLEEPPPVKKTERRKTLPFQPVFLSARNPASLREKMRDLSTCLHPGLHLEDICYTLGKGRDHFSNRLAIVTDSVDELINTCKDNVNGGQEIQGSVLTGVCKGKGKIYPAFFFSCNGTGYRDTGSRLYRTYTVFKNCIEECEKILQKQAGPSLIDDWKRIDRELDDNPQHDIGEIAAFVIGYSLAKLLTFWGIEPAAVLGDKTGHYAAACFAGALEIDEALRLVLLQNSKICHSVETDNVFDTISFAQPIIPFMDSLTGKVLNDKKHIAESCRQHFRTPDDTLKLNRLRSSTGSSVLLEMGTSHPRLRKVLQDLESAESAVFVPTLLSSHDERYAIVKSLAALYVFGIDVDLDYFYRDADARIIPLPTYPFQRKRFWVSNKNRKKLPKTEAIRWQEEEIKPHSPPDRQQAHQRQEHDPAEKIVSGQLNGAGLISQEEDPNPDGGDTEIFLKDLVGRLLKLQPDNLDVDINFSEYGMDSISIAELIERIEIRFRVHMDPSLIFVYSTITTLAQFLNEKLDSAKSLKHILKTAATLPGNSETHSQKELLKQLYAGGISTDEALEKTLGLYGREETDRQEHKMN